MVFVLIFFQGAGRAAALEFEAVAGAGNMVFDPAAEHSLGVHNETFQPPNLVLGHFSLAGKLSDTIEFDLRIERDLLLLNRVQGLIGMDTEYLDFKIGPVMGPFNTEEKPLGAGISAGFLLEYPGVVFAALSGSALGYETVFSGDYVQNTVEASAGFWIPHVVFILSMNTKLFTRRMNDLLLVRDELTRYGFSADVFSKNVPYTIRIDMGYQTLKRSYIPGSAGSSDSDIIKSLYLGFEGTWRVRGPLKLILGLEMPVFSWAEQPLKSPGRETVLYSAHAGISWTFKDRR